MNLFVLAFSLVSVLGSNACAQQTGAIQINSSADIHFIVTAPSGKRTGADPRGAHADTIYQTTFLREIPRANYAFSGFDPLDGPPGPDSHEFNFNPNSPGDDGVYTIHAIGTKLSTFWLTSYVLQDIGPEYRRSTFQLGGPIDKDSIVTFTFTYYGDSSKQLVFEKFVDASGLLRDIGAMRRLRWITNTTTANKYGHLTRKYAKLIRRNDPNGARSTLAAIAHNITADSARGLTIDACIHLRRDAESLLRGMLRTRY